MIKPAALHHVLHHHHAGHHAHATTFFFFTGLCDKGPNFAFSKDRGCITLGLSAFPYFGFSLLRIQAFGRFGMPATHEMAHSIKSTATWLKEWQSRHDICLELDVVPRFFSLVDDLGQPITHNQRNAVCIRLQFEGLHQIYRKLDLRCLEILPIQALQSSMKASISLLCFSFPITFPSTSTFKTSFNSMKDSRSCSEVQGK